MWKGTLSIQKKTSLQNHKKINDKANNSQKRTLYLTKHRATTGSTVATVFGATGFLGRYVVNRLARNGAQIVIPYRGNEMDYAHLKPIGEVGQILPMKFHTESVESIERAIEKSNIVINLIGKKWPTRNYSFHASNVETAKAVATACAKLGVDRLIHASCVGADVNSPSGYLKSKAESENIVKEIFPSATIVRATPMYGHNDYFLNRFGRICQLSYPYIFSLIDPEVLMQPLAAEDFGAAMVPIVENPQTKGKTFELGGPEILSFQEFIEEIVLPGSQREQMKIVRVPANLAPKIARSIGWTRKPVWWEDDLQFWAKDKVVTGTDPTALMKEWNLRPTRLADHAVNVLRFFRPSSRVTV